MSKALLGAALPSLTFACQAALGIFFLPTSWPPCGPSSLLMRETLWRACQDSGLGPQEGL